MALTYEQMDGARYMAMILLNVFGIILIFQFFSSGELVAAFVGVVFLIGAYKLFEHGYNVNKMTKRLEAAYK